MELEEIMNKKSTFVRMVFDSSIPFSSSNNSVKNNINNFFNPPPAGLGFLFGETLDWISIIGLM